jgi:hypothetical protein
MRTRRLAAAPKRWRGIERKVIRELPVDALDDIVSFQGRGLLCHTPERGHKRPRTPTP